MVNLALTVGGRSSSAPSVSLLLYMYLCKNTYIFLPHISPPSLFILIHNSSPPSYTYSFVSDMCPGKLFQWNLEVPFYSVVNIGLKWTNSFSLEILVFSLIDLWIFLIKTWRIYVTAVCISTSYLRGHGDWLFLKTWVNIYLFGHQIVIFISIGVNICL